jgi:predicted methyltransferase
MKRTAVLLSVVAACSANPEPAPVSAPPPAATPVVATAPPPVASAAPAEPTADEKAKAEAAAQLKTDREKLQADHQAELARWTPELRAEAKKLTAKDFKSGHEALLAVLASKHRRPASPERDKDRHPVETFDFYGLKPTMTVIELAPGEGWFTEVLAPVLYKKGKLFCTNTDPNGPKDDRMTFYGERFKMFVERVPEIYGKVETITITPATPSLPEATADMVVMMRAAHGMVNAGSFDKWLGAAHKALKPNGILAVEQHRAKPDAVPEESAKKGYLPEKWVIEKIEAAGFKLQAKSEINANPKDTKDYPDGVWTLPPTFRLGDKDRAKYTAIGESDRMTLRFVRLK